MELLSWMVGLSLLLEPTVVGAPGGSGSTTPKVRGSGSATKPVVSVFRLSVSGALDKVAIWGALRKARPAFRRCHRRFGLKHKVLIRDRLTLRFGIGRKGRPGRVRSSQFKPKLPAAQRCFRRAIRKVRFPKWSGRSPFVRLKLVVRNMASHPGSGSIRPWILRGRVTATAGYPVRTVNRVVGRHQSSLGYCYLHKGLRGKPTLAGAVILEHTVDAKGRVSKARVVESTLKSPSTIQCFLKALRRWRYPMISEMSPSVVRLRFFFDPGR